MKKCNLDIVLGNILDRDGDRGLVKGSIYAVDWDRVMGIGSITANIHDDRELAIGIFQGLSVDEGRNRLTEVNAVDKDVGYKDFSYKNTVIQSQDGNSHSTISTKGPPLAVSVISHCKTFPAGMPTLSAKSTAPFPHLPKAPITKALGLLPIFAPLNG